MNSNDKEQIDAFLKDELPKFEDITGTSNVIDHKKKMKSKTPFRHRYIPNNPAKQNIFGKLVEELLANNCIEPSFSSYNSPIVLATKKNAHPNRYGESCFHQGNRRSNKLKRCREFQNWRLVIIGAQFLLQPAV